VITVLEYIVIAAVIGLVVFVLAVFVFGRGEQMAPLAPRTSPSELPENVIGGDDVRRVRFGLALRGYRMSDVDWTLDRLADELDRLHRRLSALTGEPLPPGVAPERAGEEVFPGEPATAGATLEPPSARPDLAEQ
jgi:DivIVA domain-containing protein